jgi:hypothetical protein
LFTFFFFKIREQEDRTGPEKEKGLAPVGGGRWQGKDIGGLMQCK